MIKGLKKILALGKSEHAGLFASLTAAYAIRATNPRSWYWVSVIAAGRIRTNGRAAIVGFRVHFCFFARVPDETWDAEVHSKNCLNFCYGWREA